MKPYLAILIDSYWETVSSKVLWALLIGWSLLLIGLAPFGYVSENSYRMVRGDIRNRVGLAQKMAKGLTPAGTNAQRAISQKLSPALRKQLESANATLDLKDRNDRFAKISTREIVADLNDLLKNRQLYSLEAFPTASNRQRLRPILERDVQARTDEDVEALNRVLLDMAYSADMASPRSEQLWVGYGGIKLGDALPLDRATVNKFVERVALEIIIRLGLSFVAVFVGLIVTSTMIPETFRSGSLHLLLSKPVSRPLVYLTKFLGGTLFVLVNIAYLLTGLFLLVGWRLGIWNTGLLLCIPLLLFVFVIFYSVSALVGLIWNNPIICVVVCIVFWIFCLVIGVLESSLRIPARWTPQIVRFLEINDDVIGVTQAGGVKVWNDDFDVWQPVADLNEAASGRVLGPLYDAQRNRLVMRSDFMDGMGGYATRSRNFVYADLRATSGDELSTEKQASDDRLGADVTGDDMIGGRTEVPTSALTEPSTEPNIQLRQPGDAALASASEEPELMPEPKTAEEARRKSHWPFENGLEPPMLMLDLLQFNGMSLAVSRNGIFEIDWASQEVVDAAKATGGVFGNVASWLGRIQPQPFKDLSPVGYTFSDDVRVAATYDQTRLFLVNGNQVDALQWNQADGKFKVEHSLKIDGETHQSALIACGSGHCVIARSDTPLIVVPRDLSAVTASVALPGGSDVRQLQAIANTDRISIVTHAGDWFEFEGSTQHVTRVKCPWQGAISGVTWLDNTKAWVGIEPNRAALWNSQTGAAERFLQPTPSRLDLFYAWVARPLYLINPKPSSLNGVLETLLSKDEPGQTQIINNDLAAGRVEVEIWQPILSNAAFVLILLTVGCVYVWRKEF